MSTLTADNVIPVAEDYGSEIVVNAAEAEQKVGQLLEPPLGWSLDRITLGPMTLGFASPDNALAGSGVTNSGGDAPVPVIAQTQTQAARLWFAHGSETFDVQIIPLSDPLVATWARNLLGRGPQTSIGIGHGFTAGDTTILSAGQQFIRATYGDTSPVALSNAGTPTWRAQVSSRAADLAGQLTRP